MSSIFGKTFPLLSLDVTGRQFERASGGDVGSNIRQGFGRLTKTEQSRTRFVGHAWRRGVTGRDIIDDL